MLAQVADNLALTDRQRVQATAQDTQFFGGLAFASLDSHQLAILKVASSCAADLVVNQDAGGSRQCGVRAQCHRHAYRDSVRVIRKERLDRRLPRRDLSTEHAADGAS
jgi:hypothetical protein